MCSSDRLVGKKVRKCFEGAGWFDGEIMFKHNLGDNAERKTEPVIVYRIKYSDGDEEDLAAEEIQDFLVVPLDGVSEPRDACAAGAGPDPTPSSLSKKRRRSSSSVAPVAAVSTTPLERLNISARELVEAHDRSSPHERFAEALGRLHSAAIAADAAGVMGEADVDCLIRVLQVLEPVVVEGQGLVAGDLENSSSSLEAAVVVLSLMAGDGVDQRLLCDEVMGSCLLLLKQHLTMHAPACLGSQKSVEDGSCKGGSAKKKRAKAGRKKGEGPLDDGEEEEEQVVAAEDDSEKDRHRSSSKAAPPQSKPALRMLRGTVSKLCEMMGIWERLVRRVHLDDGLLMSLCAACMEVLVVDPPSSLFSDLLLGLQLAAVGVVAAVFSTRPAQRPALIEDVVSICRRLPQGRKQMRALHMPTSGGSSIQVVTGMALRFVQCVPAVAADEAATGSQTLSSGRAVSIWFVRRLLARCSGDEPAGSCFRMVVSSIVDDLLESALLPQWPAVELVLCSLCGELVTSLRDLSLLKHPTATTLHSLDLLGRVAAFLAKLIREEQDDEDQLFHKCSCEDEREGDSDRRWICPACVVRAQKKCHVVMLAKRHGAIGLTGDLYDWNEASVPEVNISDVLRQLVLNSIASQTQADAWVSEARLHLLDQWQAVEQEEGRTDMAAHWRDQRDASPQTEAGWGQATLKGTELRRACRALMMGRELASSFDAILSQLLSPLGAEGASARSRAVKAISGVIASDPALMGKESVQAALSRRLHDEAISVREAVVNLVGGYVVQGVGGGLDLLQTYLGPLMERLVDRGVSVRKSVVRTLRECLLGQRSHPRAPYICCALMERAAAVKEEETIRILIHQTFSDLWFAPGVNAAAAARQMIDVETKQPGSEWFEELIVSIASRDGDQARCQGLVESLVEILLEVGEANTNGEPRNQQVGDEEKEASAGQLLAVLTLLHAFCRASPALLVDHMGSLYPHLHGNGGSILTREEGGTVCILVSRMLRSVLPLLRNPDDGVMRAVAADLVRATHRYGAQAVSASVDCLSRLAAGVTHDDTPVRGLLERCVGYLKGYGKKGGASRQFLLRAFIIAGCVCRFSPPADRDPNAGEGNGGLSIDSVYELLRSFVRDTAAENEVRAKAMQGLLMLLMGSPRTALLAQKQGIFEMTLDPSISPTILAQVLRGCCELLEVAEEHVERGTLDSEEGSVAGGVLQLHLGAILKIQLHPQARVRSAAVSLLGVMLKQGLVNPMDAVPRLVALQGDTQDPLVRAQALHHLLLVEEKGMSQFLGARLADGILMSCSFQETVFGGASALFKEGDDGESDPSSVFGPLYMTCFRPARATRRRALQALVGLLLDPKQPCSIVAFVSQALAHLPYELQEEPLLVIHFISRHLSLHGGACEAALKHALRSSRVSIPNDEDEEDEDADVEEEKACMGGGDVKDRREVAAMQDLCAQAAALAIVLRLKHFLKRVYSLSDTRCMHFSLSESVKISDRSLPTRTVHSAFDPGELICRFDHPAQQLGAYVELRKLLAGDPSDLNIAPPINTSRKRKVASTDMSPEAATGGKKGPARGSKARRRKSADLEAWAAKEDEDFRGSQ